MKQAKIVFIFFFFIQTAFNQTRGSFHERSFVDYAFNEQLFYSYWINPVQYDENLIFNYHIRYDFLLFEKNSIDKSLRDAYHAKLKVMLELSSPDLLLPIRNIEEVTIKTQEFDQTRLKNQYYSSNFSLKVPNKKYKVTFTIFDEIRNKEFSLRPFELNLEDNSDFELIFIKETDLFNISSVELKNKFYNFLPFSSEKYVLLLPEHDYYKELNIFNKFVKYKITSRESSGFRYNIFSLDTLDLIEGDYKLNWNAKVSKTKSFSVRWLDKPEYLKNFENALKIMTYLFEENSELSRFYSDKEEQRKKFFDKWKKFDPTPSTPYNELLTEFYRRADYAYIEFKSVSQPDGALTDRGKIYIIYGPPAKVERSFSKDGRSIEIWTYKTTREIKFTFFDENKNGDFILQK